MEHVIYYTAICASGGIGTSKSKYIGFECAVATELLPNRARFHQGLHPESKMVYGDFTAKIDEIAKLHIEKTVKAYFSRCHASRSLWLEDNILMMRQLGCFCMHYSLLRK